MGSWLEHRLGKMYRSLLWLYPPPFRRQYAEELWLVYRDVMQSPEQAIGIARGMQCWLLWWEIYC